MKKKLIASLLGAALLAGCAEDASRTQVASGPEASAGQFNGTDITGIDYQTDFQLVDHNGQPRSMADFKGKATLVFFGFANCPDVCPTTLARMGQAVYQLEAQGEHVQGLFITLDPQRDTAGKLKQYVTTFQPGFLGLRGDEKTLEQLAKNYHIHMKSHAPKAGGHAQHAGENYMVEHSGAVFVSDRNGNLRLIFIGADWTSGQMAHDLKKLLNS
jgi:protein SCO1/2